MAANTQVIGKLRKLLGPGQVSTRHESLYLASMDNLRYSRMPSARIRPSSEDDVESVLKLANEHQIPVTTRGAGSATTGTTSPTKDGWVLDMSGWTRCHIDPVARMAFVQPGLTIAELDKAAEQHGLMYPVDPGSLKHATIGGTIATNAGGMRAAKYGVTRDYVVALEGFLPTGDFVRWGANLKKFSAGFNMRDLWIGSEGSLGVITGGVIKLIPRPEARATCLAVFPSADEALTCSHDLLLSGESPSALEFLDAETVGCTFSFWRKRDQESLDQLPMCLRKWSYSHQPPALLLIELDGSTSATRSQLNRVESFISDRTDDWMSAMDEQSTELLWKIRRSCSQAMFELGSRKLNEDVVVPFDCQLALINFASLLQEEYGLPTPTFGHAADGNFHVHIMYDDENPEAAKMAQAAIHKLMEHVIELGGAISGEHGIGLAKTPFFKIQHSEAEISAMKAVKAALDPMDILNPGKIFEEAEPWTFPRENIKLPWDH